MNRKAKMGSIFRLEKFPHVCRLCLESPDSHPVVMVSLSAKDPALEDESIGDFITAITFLISEDKHDQLPNMICLPCLELLRFFAKYRSKINTIHLLMNSLVELKHSNPIPLEDLFRSKSGLVRAVIKDLDLCTVDNYTVLDLVKEFRQYGAAARSTKHIVTELNEEAYLPRLPREVNPKTSEADEHYSLSDDDDELIEPMKVVPEEKLKLPTKSNPVNRKKGIKKPAKSFPSPLNSDSSDDCPILKKLKLLTKSGPEDGKGFPMPLDSDSSDDLPILKKLKLPTKVKPVSKKQNATVLKCDKCPFTTRYKQSMQSHQRWHIRKENRRYRCSDPNCKAMFINLREYQKHTAIAHKLFVCDICGAQHSTKSRLAAHMNRHSKTYDHHCPYCPRRTYTKGELSTHIKRIHQDQRKYSCDTCGLTFRQKRSLEDHLPTHSEVRNFACKLCDKKFRRAANLKKHHRIVHEKFRLPCNHCASSFQTLYKLKDHIESAHGVQTRFLCDICVELFHSQEDLDTHKIRHDNPKELECPTCLLITPSVEQLGNHMCITYRDDYVCCERDFRYHYFYNKHMLIKHGIRVNVRVKPIPGVLLGQIRAQRKRIESCPRCEKIFTTRTQKKQHMEICTVPDGGGSIATQPVNADLVTSAVDSIVNTGVF